MIFDYMMSDCRCRMKVTAMLAAVLQLLTTALATAGAETYDFSYRAGGQPPAPTPCPAGWRGCDGPASIRLWQGDAPDEHAGFPAEAENVRCLTPNVTMKECKDICVSDVKVRCDDVHPLSSALVTLLPACCCCCMPAACRCLSSSMADYCIAVGWDAGFRCRQSHHSSCLAQTRP
jgi:hypothetical protein